MGGSGSIDFLAPSGSGENTLVTCERGDYAADLEVARGIPRAPEFPERLDAPEEVATPGVTTIEALATLLGIDAAATSKAMPVTKRDGTRRARARSAATTGSRRRSSPPRSTVTFVRRPRRRSAQRSAPIPARSGPSASSGEIVADETLREGQFVAGANRTGFHLRGVEQGRDFQARFADMRQAARGRQLPALRRRGSASRPRSRWGTSSSSRRGSRSRSAPPSSTRTARNGR